MKKGEVLGKMADWSRQKNGVLHYALGVSVGVGIALTGETR